MLPILFVPQMLFAGFFVTPSLIPVWLRWARYLCTLTYASRILLVAEFDRDCGSAEGDKKCQTLLSNVEAVPDDTWWNWLVLVSLFIVVRCLALFVLRKKATKFY
jgi:ABC-type multidrug transport system permease subunit